MANPWSVQSFDIKNDFGISKDFGKLLRRPLLYPAELRDHVENSSSKYRKIHERSNTNLLSAPNCLFTLVYTDLNKEIGGELGDAFRLGSFLSVSTDFTNSKPSLARRQRRSMSSSCTAQVLNPNQGASNAEYRLPVYSGAVGSGEAMGLEARQNAFSGNCGEIRRCFDSGLKHPRRQHQPRHLRARHDKQRHESVTLPPPAAIELSIPLESLTACAAGGDHTSTSRVRQRVTVIPILGQNKKNWRNSIGLARDAHFEHMKAEARPGTVLIHATPPATQIECSHIQNQRPGGFLFTQSTQSKAGVIGAMRLEIVNFEKYNPRTDRKAHSWFRLENDFVSDEKLFKLTPLEKFVWVCILGFRNKKQQQIFELDLDYLADHIKVKKNVISSAIKKLANAKPQAILVHENDDAVTTGNQLVSTGITTNVRTYVTNERTNVITSGVGVDDFETVWEAYPRKIDKTEARDRFHRLIKPGDLEDLLTAVRNYSEDCRRLKTQDKYIKHFSSFLGTESKERWRDWIDYEPPMSAVDQVEAEFLSRYGKDVTP